MGDDCGGDAMIIIRILKWCSIKKGAAEPRISWTAHEYLGVQLEAIKSAIKHDIKCARRRLRIVHSSG